MTPQRLSELLAACPELTLADINRLHLYRPKRSVMFVACQAAFLQLSMA